MVPPSLVNSFDLGKRGKPDPNLNIDYVKKMTPDFDGYYVVLNSNLMSTNYYSKNIIACVIVMSQTVACMIYHPYITRFGLSGVNKRYILSQGVVYTNYK